MREQCFISNKERLSLERDNPQHGCVNIFTLPPILTSHLSMNSLCIYVLLHVATEECDPLWRKCVPDAVMHLNSRPSYEMNRSILHAIGIFTAKFVSTE